ILAHLRPAEGAPVPGQGRRRGRPGAAQRLRDELIDLPPTELGRLIQTLEEEMHEAAADLRFEYAARLRDEVNELKRELREAGVCPRPSPGSPAPPRARRTRRAAPAARRRSRPACARCAGEPTPSPGRWWRWPPPGRPRRAGGARSSRGRPGGKPGGRP